LFEEKLNIAKKWFAENQVEIPSGAKAWQRKTVTSREIPPGCTYANLRSNDINISDFIAALKGTKSKKVTYKPITEEICYNSLGLEWLDSEFINAHKKVLTKCLNCTFEELLDYGTLQRMLKANNKFCRVCRDAGGKQKPLNFYNKFTDFTVVSFVQDSKLEYSCNKCNTRLIRGLDYIKSAEYIVCQICNPQVKNTRITTELGDFDSKIEYMVYKYLLTIFAESDILRQPKYSDLFLEVTSKHRADFYILPLDVILEITTKVNNIKDSYYDTLKIKQNISDRVFTATSIQEVKDIVRPLMKVSG
jgi:hypothetical protein